MNHVELQGKGAKYNLYFDAKTGLLLRQKESWPVWKPPAIWPTMPKSTYGILYPTKIVEQSSTDKKPVTIKSALTVNDQVNVELFKR